MRIEISTATAAREPRPRPPVRRPRFDRVELAILGLFALVSVWVLGLDLYQVVVNGRTWTGTDGVYIVDQLQYLAWIQSASQHGLAQNLFVLRSTPADYFQPAVLISGALSRIGIPSWVALLLWKPVAVTGMFFAVRAYVHRSLSGVWPRRAAIFLTLFFGSYTVLYGNVGVIGDLFPGFLSWGYTFGLLALAAMTAAIVVYDRARRRAAASWTPALLGALASLLHPWHGELLIVTVVFAEAIVWLSARRLRPWREYVLTVQTLLGTGAPLVYYLLLGKLDLSWKLARDASRHAFPLWWILLAIVPLLLPALLGYRNRPRTFIAAASLGWPLAALAVYALSASGLSATPLHAFEGITVPLSVLAVGVLSRVRLRRLEVRWRGVPLRVALAVALVAIFSIPATVSEFATAAKLAAPTPLNANFINHDERLALQYLRKAPGPGGVLTRSYLGAAVPAKTGRRTLIGDCLWSEPNCSGREAQAQALLTGTLRGAAAVRFVRASGARFVLADCGASANLTRTLASILVGVHRFGCATVYEVSPAAAAADPLAQSRGHAAVRAARRQHGSD